MDIQNGGSSVVDAVNAMRSSDVKDQTSTAIYEYSVWANPGEKLTFVPRDPRWAILTSMF